MISGREKTPKEDLPRHIHHVEDGLVALYEWNEFMHFPKAWIKTAHFIIKEHMRVHNLKSPGKIVDFMLSLERSPLTALQAAVVFGADAGCAPAISLRADYHACMDAIMSVSGKDAPERLKGKEIGDWIRQQRIKAYMRVRGDV